MVDVVAELAAQTDATLDAIIRLVTEIQKNVAQLAVLQKDADQQAAISKDTAAGIGVQIARLKQGSDAALTALRALQNPGPVGASTVAPVAPAADVPGPAAVAQTPAAASPDPVPAAVAEAAPMDGLRVF